MVLKRLLGILMLLTGLLGLAVAGVGALRGPRLVEGVGNSLTESLELASQSLDTSAETLRLAKTMVTQVEDGLDAVETTTLDVSKTISQTQPLLNEIGQIASQDVPESLEAVQASIPDMAQAAAVVDDTLTTLSHLSLEQTILGFPIHFDLGIDYAPEVPLEESVNQFGAGLEGVPSQLRNLEGDIEAASDSLRVVDRDLVLVAERLDALNGSIADSQALLDDYLHLVDETKVLVQRAQAQISRQVARVKLAVTLAMVWLGLAQVAPLYLGWELATARRD